MSISVIAVLTVTFAAGMGSILTTITLLQVSFHVHGLPALLDFAWLRPYHLNVARNIGAIGNSIFIALTNFILANVARILNDFELHRTETEYEV